MLKHCCLGVLDRDADQAGRAWRQRKDQAEGWEVLAGVGQVLPAPPPLSHQGGAAASEEVWTGGICPEEVPGHSRDQRDHRPPAPGHRLARPLCPWVCPAGGGHGEPGQPAQSLSYRPHPGPLQCWGRPHWNLHCCSQAEQVRNILSQSVNQSISSIDKLCSCKELLLSMSSGNQICYFMYFFLSQLTPARACLMY